MSVIIDTSKVSLIKGEEGIIKAYVLGLRNKNGKEVKFTIGTADMSDDELYTVFFERLGKGLLKGNKRTGGGVLRQNAEGNYYLEYENAVEKASDASDGKVHTVKELLQLPRTSALSRKPEKVIADPDDGTSMIGQKVLASCAYSFNSFEVGVLTKIERDNIRPFAVLTDKGIVHVTFIKAVELEPLALALQKVRESIRGRWLIAKDGGGEFMITRIVRNEGGSWTVHGMSASTLMKDYTFEDGSPVGQPKA